jgi:hypothetical protein
MYSESKEDSYVRQTLWAITLPFFIRTVVLFWGRNKGSLSHRRCIFIYIGLVPFVAEEISSSIDYGCPGYTDLFICRKGGPWETPCYCIRPTVVIPSE